MVGQLSDIACQQPCGGSALELFGCTVTTRLWLELKQVPTVLIQPKNTDYVPHRLPKVLTTAWSCPLCTLRNKGQKISFFFFLILLQGLFRLS